jgi:hypothetical protein
MRPARELPYVRKSSTRIAAALSAVTPSLASRNSSMLRFRARPMPVSPGYSVSSRSDGLKHQRQNRQAGQHGRDDHMDRRYYLPTRTQSKGEFITAMVGGEQRGRERSELCDDYLGSFCRMMSRGAEQRSARGRRREAGRLNRAFCVG